MGASPCSAVLLTGPVGSGKTAAAAAAVSLLAEPSAAIDLDWLAWFSAPGATVDEMLADNLHAVWTNLRRAGVERLVLARHVPTREALRRIEAALGGVELRSVRLELPREVLERRVRARDEGAELAEHLALIAADAAAERFEDARVQAEGLAPSEVARAALRAVGWL